MSTLHRLAPILAMILAATPLCAAAVAHEYRAGPITVDAPWARASIGSAGNTAAYMKLENASDAPDRLLSAKSAVAERVSLHESRMQGDVMKMGPVAGGIEIPAHGTAELKPLGLHMMLTKLVRPLKDGETFPMTLVFEKQGEVSIEVKVGQTQASTAAGHEAHHHE